jgi:cell wall-associated NlpC family hydrolase
MLSTRPLIRHASLAALAIAAAWLGGCATTPVPAAANAPVPHRAIVEPRTYDSQVGAAIADLAKDMIGTRYAYGGTSPAQGFDCSGLVFYAYTRAGYNVPRTSQEQFRATRKIALRDAGPGDLMFFQDQTKLSHVGIYLGGGQFVHAPATGQRVAVADLDSPYYREHLIAVGRLLPL